MREEIHWTWGPFSPLEEGENRWVVTRLKKAAQGPLVPDHCLRKSLPETCS